MEQSLVDLSRVCEQNANAVSAQSRTTIDCGPFRALLDLTTDMIWINYAVPIGAIDDARATAAALDDLRRAFAQQAGKLLRRGRGGVAARGEAEIVFRAAQVAATVQASWRPRNTGRPERASGELRRIARQLCMKVANAVR